MNVAKVAILSAMLTSFGSAQTVSLSTATSATTYNVGEPIQLVISTEVKDISSVSIVIVGNPFSVSKIGPSYTTSLIATADLIGLSTLQASVRLQSGVVFNSNTLTIDVEPAVTPVSIKVSPKRIAFTYIGEQEFVEVSGTVNGLTANLSHATQLSLISSNPSIAQSASDGSITAIGAGETEIQVSLGSYTQRIPVRVSVGIAGDLDGNGGVNQDDVNYLLDFLNTATSAPNDARDLNHDGRIDNTDAAILARMCMPECTVPIAFAPTDVNKDGVVDCTDLRIVKAAFGSRRGEQSYNPYADLNGDGLINIIDLATVAKSLPARSSCQSITDR